jgi:hypothetical protein
MLINGDVWVGKRLEAVGGRGIDNAKWKVYHFVEGEGSGGGGKVLVTGLIG